MAAKLCKQCGDLLLTQFEVAVKTCPECQKTALDYSARPISRRDQQFAAMRQELAANLSQLHQRRI